MCVVYFDQVSGVAHTPKLVKIPFLVNFNLFCPFLTFVIDFWSEIKKNVWKNSVLSYSLKLVDMQTLVDSLKGEPQLCLFSIDFSLKITQKGWKHPKKVFWSAFRWVQHPKTGQNTQHMWLMGRSFWYNVFPRTVIHLF